MWSLRTFWCIRKVSATFTGRVSIFALFRDYAKKGVAEKSNLAGSVGVTVFFGVYWDQYQQHPTEFSLFQDISRYKPILTGLLYCLLDRWTKRENVTRTVKTNVHCPIGYFTLVYQYFHCSLDRWTIRENVTHNVKTNVHCPICYFTLEID